MQRAASPNAKVVPVRALAKSDYLLGAAEETRLGALSFRWLGDDGFPGDPYRVAALIEPRRLLQVAERILRNEDTDEGRLRVASCASVVPAPTLP
ncbi:hypothetical protein NKH13_09210 [Mesorhizobium sp. M1348]